MQDDVEIVDHQVEHDADVRGAEREGIEPVALDEERADAEAVGGHRQESNPQRFVSGRLFCTNRRLVCSIRLTLSCSNPDICVRRRRHGAFFIRYYDVGRA